MPCQSQRPTNKLCQAIDIVRRVMADENCKLHKGFIYKFIPESTKTYTFYKSVKDYVMRIMGNADVADVLANQAYPVTRLLSEPSCRVISQLKIDYNFIEVLKGQFFNIEKKGFEENPTNLNGSPRAFVLYRYIPGRIPKPKPFIESTILVFDYINSIAFVKNPRTKKISITIVIYTYLGIENSFPNPVVLRKFLQKYYQILLHQKYPKKESKLMLVGPPDSGKTSWFCPFEGEINYVNFPET